MARRIEYSREAVKTLARIDQATSKRIRSKIEQLAADPQSLATTLLAIIRGLEALRKGGVKPAQIRAGAEQAIRLIPTG